MRDAFIYLQFICLTFLIRNHALVLECQEDGIWKGNVPYCASPNEIIVWHDSTEHRNLYNKSFKIFNCSNSGKKEPWVIRQNEEGSSIVKVAIKKNSDKINIITTKNGQQCENIKHNIKDTNFRIFIYKCKDKTNKDIELQLDGVNWYEVHICGIHVYSELHFHCDDTSLSILHGFLEPSKISASYGKHFLYICEEGFQLKGNKHVYCGEERSKNDTRCEKKNHDNNLVTPIIISISIIGLIVVLLLGWFLFKKRKTRNQKNAENRKSEHIYSEPIYMDLKLNNSFIDEPPPLPKPKQQKAEIAVNNNVIYQESENVHRDQMENESQDTENTILKETEIISSPTSTTDININNELYNIKLI